MFGKAYFQYSSMYLRNKLCKDTYFKKKYIYNKM